MVHIHPVIDHFTIGLFTASVLFELLGRIRKHEGLRHAAYWNLLFAAVAALGSYISGALIAEPAAHATGAAHDLLETHETLGLITTLIIVALFLWRSFVSSRVADKLRWLYLTVTIIGLVAVLATGFLGGEMVYKHGVGVYAKPSTISGQ